MANPDKPSGLTPVRYVDGKPYTGACNKYYVPSSDSTAVYVGGLVKLLTAAADADGVMSVTGNVATSNPVIGVVTVVVPDSATSLPYRAASTARYVMVCDDREVLYRVQDDASSTLASTAVGRVADLASFTSGNTTSGRSTIEISATSATTSGDGTEDVHIWGIYNSPDNAAGNHCDWLVRLNNWQLVDDFAGI